LKAPGFAGGWLLHAYFGENFAVSHGRVTTERTVGRSAYTLSDRALSKASANIYTSLKLAFTSIFALLSSVRALFNAAGNP
jgi:hypothetical protein